MSSSERQPVLKDISCDDCVHKGVCVMRLAFDRIRRTFYAAVALSDLSGSPIELVGNGFEKTIEEEFGAEIRITSCIHYLPKTNVIRTAK